MTPTETAVPKTVIWRRRCNRGIEAGGVSMWVCCVGCGGNGDWLMVARAPAAADEASGVNVRFDSEAHFDTTSQCLGTRSAVSRSLKLVHQLTIALLSGGLCAFFIAQQSNKASHQRLEAPRTLETPTPSRYAQILFAYDYMPLTPSSPDTTTQTAAMNRNSGHGDLTNHLEMPGHRANSSPPSEHPAESQDTLTSNNSDSDSSPEQPAESPTVPFRGRGLEPPQHQENGIPRPFQHRTLADIEAELPDSPTRLGDVDHFIGRPTGLRLPHETTGTLAPPPTPADGPAASNEFHRRQGDMIAPLPASHGTVGAPAYGDGEPALPTFTRSDALAAFGNPPSTAPPHTQNAGGNNEATLPSSNAQPNQGDERGNPLRSPVRFLQQATARRAAARGIVAPIQDSTASLLNIRGPLINPKLPRSSESGERSHAGEANRYSRRLSRSEVFGQQQQQQQQPEQQPQPEAEPTDPEAERELAISRGLRRLREVSRAVNAAGRRMETDPQLRQNLTFHFYNITLAVPRSPAVPRPPRQPLPTRMVPAGSDEDCMICIEPAEGTEVADLLCGHWFHTACINKWLDDHAMTCPMCRYMVR